MQFAILKAFIKNKSVEEHMQKSLPSHSEVLMCRRQFLMVKRYTDGVTGGLGEGSTKEGEER